MAAAFAEDLGDGTHALRDPRLDEHTKVPADRAPNWIHVFDIADEPPADGSPTPVDVQLVVATDAPTLSRLALDLAPANAVGTGIDEGSVLLALRRRTSAFLPGSCDAPASWPVNRQPGVSA